jgi:hypothetical protein
MVSHTYEVSQTSIKLNVVIINYVLSLILCVHGA